MAVKQCLIYCRCGGGNVAENLHGQLFPLFQEADADVFELHDLCAYSVNEKEVLNSISEKYQKKVIIACYPRAIKHMFIQGGINFGDFDFISFKELNPGQIGSKLKEIFSFGKGTYQYKVLKNSLDVPAWFPIIDYSRCTHCGKCARFCLFGVYQFKNKSLSVVNPLACKNLCPACGRTCPSSAIIFPRLAEKTALAGGQPGIIKIDTEGQSLFAQLNDRNKNRRNILRQGVIQQAEEERRKALSEIRNLQINKDK